MWRPRSRWDSSVGRCEAKIRVVNGMNSNFGIEDLWTELRSVSSGFSLTRLRVSDSEGKLMIGNCHTTDADRRSRDNRIQS